jgi:hypothetical protein
MPEETEEEKKAKEHWAKQFAPVTQSGAMAPNAADRAGAQPYGRENLLFAGGQPVTPPAPYSGPQQQQITMPDPSFDPHTQYGTQARLIPSGGHPMYEGGSVARVEPAPASPVAITPEQHVALKEAEKKAEYSKMLAMLYRQKTEARR